MSKDTKNFGRKLQNCLEALQGPFRYGIGFKSLGFGLFLAYKIGFVEGLFF